MALEASSLTGVRGDRTLFSGISFDLSAGEAFRVCGSNGSGKTTLLRMLCGLALPHEGQVRWRGKDIRHSRDAFHQELVYIGHDSAVKDSLAGWENLACATGIAGQRFSRHAAEAALADTGLAAQSGLAGHALSQGQRKRVALARLRLSASARLWVLDEPFTALDGSAAAFLDTMIARHLSSGGMLVYTTHQEPGASCAAARRLDLDMVAAC